MSRGASNSDPLLVPAIPSSRALLSASEVYAEADALPAFSRLQAAARAAIRRTRAGITDIMCTPRLGGGEDSINRVRQRASVSLVTSPTWPGVRYLLNNRPSTPVFRVA